MSFFPGETVKTITLLTSQEKTNLNSMYGMGSKRSMSGHENKNSEGRSHLTSDQNR